MDMDLYVYNITPPKNKEDYYNIGRKPIEIENITCECLEIPDKNFVRNCIKKCLKKHNIEYQDSLETYRVDFENGNLVIKIYTYETVKRFKEFRKVIDTKAAMKKAYKDRNDFEEEVRLNSKHWKDSINFTKVPLINEYRLLCDHNEVNYARKPFRDIAEKDLEAYRMLMSSTKGNPDSSFVIFDKSTEIVFKQLIRLVQDKNMTDHLLSMLPLQENQIIVVDW